MTDPAPSPGPLGPPPAGPRPDEVRLSQDLGLRDATLLGVGALLGGGVFVLVGIAAGVAGPAVLLAFALNGLITIPTLMVYAELGSAYHDAGGGYLWVKDGLGQPWGFLGGWMGWFSHAVACAVYALASAAFFVWLLGTIGIALPGLLADDAIAMKAFAALFLAGFVGLNYVGVHQSAKTENAITYVVLLVTFLFICFGLYAAFTNPARVSANFTESFPHGAEGLFLAMGLTFIAFEGYEVIAQASEEVRNAKYNIPKAIWLSLAIVVPIYLLVVFVTIGATLNPEGGPSWLFLSGHAEVAIVEAAAQFMPYGGLVVVSAGLLMQLTALNATIYSSSRVSFAMGRDRNLPKAFASVHPRRRTPHVSVFVSGAIVLAAVLTLPIHAVAAAADIMFLLLFFLVDLSYIKLRKTTKHLDFGYRAKGFPVLPLLGLAGQVFLAVYLFRYSPTAWYTALVWLGVGALVYYAYARRNERPVVPRIPVDTTTVFAARGAERRPYRVLVPVANPATVEALMRIAVPLARENDGEVVILNVITVPPTTLPSAARDLWREGEPLLEQARAAAGDVPTHTIVKIGHDTAHAILETIEEEEADVMVLGWRGHRRAKDFVFGSTLDPILRRAPCRLLLVRLTGSGRFEKVLVPTRLGRQAPLALSVATTLAHQHGGEVDVLHVITPASAEEVAPSLREPLIRRLLQEEVRPPVEPNILLRESEDVVGTVVAESSEHDVLVVGASGETAWRLYLLGDPIERIAREAKGTVIVVKEPGLLRRAVAYRMADAVVKWAGYLRRDRDVAERASILPRTPRRR
ncbi:MAG TPA: amino acid permease [Candidatus Thermoplasmatota archaeon]|nr:amino acid permease [Candidatus Thermoplasmatota archaeon]